MNSTPLQPEQLYTHLLYLNTTQIQCIQPPPETSPSSTLKQNLLTQIQQLSKIKKTMIDLIHTKKQLKTTLQQLYNYRQSIDYDQKYKLLQYDHYSFPYLDNKTIQKQLENVRMINFEKRRQINQLSVELKQKLEVWQGKKLREKWLRVDMIEGSAAQVKRVKSQHDLSWVNRMEDVKKRYLNEQKQFKRAKIRHDYNLLVDRNGCQCLGRRSCLICSQLSNKKTARFTSPSQGDAVFPQGYKSIYRQ